MLLPDYLYYRAPVYFFPQLQTQFLKRQREFAKTNEKLNEKKSLDNSYFLYLRARIKVHFRKKDNSIDYK